MGLLSYYNGKHSLLQKNILTLLKVFLIMSGSININNIVVTYFWYINFVIKLVSINIINV